jgi:DNA-binding response OmpR family regulator
MSEIRVLLVDDEEELVATLEERLEMRGIRATAATSGGEALAMIGGTSFDVAVVDLKMPGLDGHEIVRAIRAHSPDTQIIFITGHGSGGEEVESPPVPEFRVLLKPFPIETLVDHIRELAEARGTKS